MCSLAKNNINIDTSINIVTASIVEKYAVTDLF